MEKEHAANVHVLWTAVGDADLCAYRLHVLVRIHSGGRTYIPRVVVENMNPKVSRSAQYPVSSRYSHHRRSRLCENRLARRLLEAPMRCCGQCSHNASLHWESMSSLARNHHE